MPTQPDYLGPYEPRPRYYDDEAMVDAAQRSGRAQAYADLGYVAPKAGVGASEFYDPVRPAIPKSQQPKVITDPFKTPDYLALERQRSELRQQEELHRQALRDFDAGDGAQLKWKPDTTQSLLDRGIAAINPRDYVRPSDALPFRIQEMARGDPNNPELVKMTRAFQLLQERRNRISEEADRVAQARQRFDQEVFVPTRDALMGAGRSIAPTVPDAPDYLAPTSGPWADRIREINLNRRDMGQAPIQPGTMGDRAAAWEPLDRPTQTPSPLPDEFENYDQTRRVTANFDTVLSPRDEQKFSEWKARFAPNDSGADYDLRGAFKANLTPDANGHWPDTFKKPNHPTFSNESIYANENAGRWLGGRFISPQEDRQTIGDAMGETLSAEARTMGTPMPDFLGRAIINRGGRWGDLAAEIVPGVLGGIAGSFAAPGLGTAAGGALGGAAGDVLAQARQYVRGERSDFSPTEAGIAGAANAVPLGAPFRAGGRLVNALATGGRRAAQGALIGSASEVARQAIDESGKPWDPQRIGEAGGMGAVLGGAFGAAEGGIIRPQRPAAGGPPMVPTGAEPPGGAPAAPSSSGAAEGITVDPALMDEFGAAESPTPTAQAETAPTAIPNSPDAPTAPTVETAPPAAAGKPLPPTWRVTVQEPQIPGEPRSGFQQVDMLDANGNNAGSISPDDLRAQGYDVPDLSQTKTGQYNGDMTPVEPLTPSEVALPAEPSTTEPISPETLAPTQPEEPSNAPNPIVESQGNLGEHPSGDAGAQTAEAGRGDSPVSSAPEQGQIGQQGDAGLSGARDATQVGSEPTADAPASTPETPPASGWTDKAISALESLKVHKPGQTAAATPITLAWDGAIDTAILGIKAGRAVADVIAQAVQHFRDKFPDATPEDEARLSKSIAALHANRDPSVSGGGPEPTASAPTFKHIETLRAAGAPLESVERTVMPRAEAQAGAKAARETHGDTAALEKAFAGDLPAGHDTVVITDAEKALLEKFNAAKSPEEKAQVLADFTGLSRRAATRATDLGRQVKFHDEVNRWTPQGLLDAAVEQTSNKRAKVLGESGVKAADDAVKVVNDINAKAATEVAAQPDLTSGVKLTKESAGKVGTTLKKGTPQPDLDKQIQGALKDLNLKVRDIVKQHYTVGEAAGRTLSEKLVSDAGLTGAEADTLAAKVQKRFAELTTDAKRAELTKRLKSSMDAGVGKIARRTVTDKLIEQSNIGALTNGEQLLNMVAKDLKIPTLNVEQATRLSKIAEKIQAAPEGFKRNEAIVDALSELKKIEGVGKTDLATAIFYAHILSLPTTQLLNFGSTGINTAMDLGLTALTNPKRVGDIIGGALEGVQEGGRQFKRTLRTGVSDKGLTSKTGGAQGEGLNASPTLEILSKDTTANPAVRGYAKALRYVGRLMSASDAVFYETAKGAHDYVAAAKLAEMAGTGKMTRSEVNRKARDLLATTPFDFESARAQASREGFTGSEQGYRTAEIIRQRRALRLGEQNEAGHQYALNATFNEKPKGVLGLIAESVANTASKYPALKLAVPFTRIVANVANASLNYSPVGLGRAIRGKTGMTLPSAEALRPLERQQMFAKGVAGTVGMIGGAMWAINQGDPTKQPRLTGRGPSDMNARNQLRETGWIPYSVKVGDRYYSYLNTPAAIPAAIIGNWADKIHYDKLNEKAWGTGLAKALATVPETVTNMSFLQGLSQLATIMKGGDEGVKAAQQMAQNTVGSVVPNAVQFVDRAFDPTVRETSGPLATLAGRIPGVRESLPARLSVRGETVQSGVLDRFTRPAQGDDLANYIAQTQNWIPGADRPSFGAPGKKRAATDDEYRQFQQIRGQQINAQLQQLLPQIRRLPPEQAKKIVDSIASRATTSARVQVELAGRGGGNGR
jgi:hypothetical protein